MLKKIKKSYLNFLYIFVALAIIGAVAYSVNLSSQYREKSSIIIGSKKSIGILEIYGVIIDSEHYVKTIDSIIKDNAYSAVVVKVDSPGGAVTPSYDIYLALKRLNAAMPVYVSMGNTAASGGYMISLAATKIFAYPTTITGSVGVITESVGVKKLLDKLGLEPRVYTSGKSKDIGSPVRPVTPQDREQIGALLNEIHRIFINLVLENRKLIGNDATEILDGRVFIGNQALEVGLIDEIGDFNKVITAIKNDYDLEGAVEEKIELDGTTALDRFFETKVKNIIISVRSAILGEPRFLTQYH